MIPFTAYPVRAPLLLDLHRPDASAGDCAPSASPAPPLPVIVFVHGGGWRVGDRRKLVPGHPEVNFDRMTRAGFAVASIDYRLSDEATFPAQLDDVVAALDWIRDQGPQHDLDVERVVLWGESAGAHLAALAGLAEPHRVRGVVDWYGPTDLLALPKHLDPDREDELLRETDSREALLLGGPLIDRRAAASDASPAHRVGASAPSFHIAHGTDDELVPIAQSEALVRALEAAGHDVEFTRVAGAGHLWTGVSDATALLDAALGFAKRVTILSVEHPQRRE